MRSVMMGKSKNSIATELRITGFARATAALKNNVPIGWMVTFNSPINPLGSNAIAIYTTNGVVANISQIDYLNDMKSVRIWIDNLSYGEYYITLDPTRITSPTLGQLQGESFESPRIIFDNESPSVVSINPPNNSTNIPMSEQVFTLQMSENILRGDGTISIKKIGDGTLVQAYDSANGDVLITGDSVSFAVDEFPEPFTEYFITVPVGAFKDMAGNGFSGIIDSTTWRIKTVIGPPTAQVSNITGTKTKTTISLTVTKPLGARIIVLVKAGTSSIIPPANDCLTFNFANLLNTNNDYEAVDNSVYGSAGVFGSTGYRVALAGGVESATSQYVTITGLTGNTNYRFYAYAYYKDETGCYYNTSIAPFTLSIKTNLY